MTDQELAVQHLKSCLIPFGSVIAGHLRKAGFRRDIKGERLDLIIRGLMKIRKTLLSVAGFKDAIVQSNHLISKGIRI